MFFTLDSSLYHMHSADQIKEIFEPLFQVLAFSTNLQEIFLDASLSSIFGDLIVRYLPQIRKLKFADVNGEGFCHFPEMNWLPELKCLDTLVLSDLLSFRGQDDFTCGVLGFHTKAYFKQGFRQDLNIEGAEC